MRCQKRVRVTIIALTNTVIWVYQIPQKDNRQANYVPEGPVLGCTEAGALMVGCATSGVWTFCSEETWEVGAPVAELEPAGMGATASCWDVTELRMPTTNQEIYERRCGTCVRYRFSYYLALAVLTSSQKQRGCTRNLWVASKSLKTTTKTRSTLQYATLLQVIMCFSDQIFISKAQCELVTRLLFEN